MNAMNSRGVSVRPVSSVGVKKMVIPKQQSQNPPAKITKKDARNIDTTKSKISSSTLNSEDLEKSVTEFQIEYFDLIKNTYPTNYETKMAT